MATDERPDAAFARDAFISYANQDAAVAEALCAHLEQRGFSCWIAPRDVRPGAQYADAIVRAINGASVLVLVLSQNSVASPHVGKEIERASSKRRPIIALRTDTAPLTPALEYFLSESQWIDATPAGQDAAFEKLASAIGALLAAPAATGAAPPRSAPGHTPARLPGTPAVPARTRWFVAAGAAIAAGIAFLGMPRPWQAAHTPTASAAVAAAGAATGTTGAHTAKAHQEQSVAVLPFEDLSEKKNEAYFSDGLSIELIDQLAKIPGLRVPARMSSFYFKGRQATLQEIAHSLNVTHVLEGTVSSSGQTLRVSTDLVSVDTGTPVWSETYDRKLDDIFKIQDDIAGSVVTALKVALLPSAAPRARSTTNAAAYTEFLKCQEAQLLDNRTAVANSIRYCQSAVDGDPAFAPAWIGLAGGIMAQFAGFSGSTYEVARPRALAAIQRALALEPDDAEAHLAMAQLLFQLDFNPAAANGELKRALALDPNSGDVAWLNGYIADVQCRFDDARRAFNRTLARNPLFVDVYVQLGNVGYRSGNLAAAKESYRHALTVDPNTGSVHYRLGLVALLQGDPKTALSEFQQEPDPDFHAVGLPLAYDALGRRADADRALARAKTSSALGAAYQIALIYAERKDAAETFAWLDRAYRQRDAGMLWIKGDPLLAALRPDPRFQVLLREMHLE